jgi:hypothetical protein
MTDETDNVCENCKWYTESHAQTHGYCRVMPPVFTHLDDRGRPRFFNPLVSPHSYCSLFED